MDTRRPAPRFLLLGLTVLLIGLSLRAPLLSVSTLLGVIRSDLGMSKGVGGLLTTIPVLCFGLVSPLAPPLARRFGMERVLASVLLVLVSGILIRLIPGTVSLFTGTVVLGAAIAVGNVLLPGFVKREAPNHVGPFTSVYSAAISGSGALGAGLTLPIMHTFHVSWRRTLAWPAGIALIALLTTIPWLRDTARHSSGRHHQRGHQSVWSRSLAWWVALYMGMQSILFFSIAAWLPTYLAAQGMSASHAGGILALNPLFGMAGSFVAPLLVERRDNQKWLIWLSSSLIALALIGLLAHPLGFTVIWVFLFGLGSGMTLSLALSFIGLRTANASLAADLSSMSQAIGYSIAAIGPFLIGLIADAAGNWHVPMLVILSFVLPLTMTGIASARNIVMEGNQPIG